MPAGIVQPLSGIWLLWRGGFNPTDFWLTVTYGLFILAGCCWLPVIWIQLQLKNMLQESLTTGSPLPARYEKLFRIWFLLGWPAFLALLAIFYLMVAKPS